MIIAALAYLVFGLVLFIYFIIVHTIHVNEELRPPSFMTNHIQEVLIFIDIFEGVLRVGGCILMICLQNVIKIEVKRKNESCFAIHERRESLIKEKDIHDYMPYNSNVEHTEESFGEQ